MISARTFILALLLLWITPTLCVPIHFTTGDTYDMHTKSLRARDSPLLASNGYGSSGVTRGGIVPRSSIDWELETRSVDDMTDSMLTKRTGEDTAVVRRSFWSGIKKGFKKIGKAAGNVVKKVGNAAKSTVKFVKKHGAKVAKVYFKAIAAASKVASHAVVFIPGIGKPVGDALKQVSKVSDFVSSKIPAKMSKGWEKAMRVLDRVQHPLGKGIAGKVLDKVLKRDTEEEEQFKRDLIEGDRLYERNVPALDVRSFEDGEDLEARSLDGEGIEARSFDGEDIEARSSDDVYELDARSFDDGLELEARAWDFEVEE